MEATIQHLFFDKNYEETVDLLVSARDYLSTTGRSEMKSMTPMGRMMFAQESSRVTARLTQLMSWMLYHKGVTMGEIDVDEAIKETTGLLEENICLEDSKQNAQHLPHQLRELLDKSYNLYHRIARIDKMMRQDKKVGKT